MSIDGTDFGDLSTAVDESDLSAQIQEIHAKAALYDMSCATTETISEQPSFMSNLDSEAPSIELDETRDHENDDADKGEKKKKKKKKGRGVGANQTALKRGPTAMPKNRGTGFEEFYADPPMTAEEVKQERNELYAPDIPFARRMQTCVQRFRSRRRLQNHLSNYFDRYLFLGGVDSTPNSYGGWDPKDLKDLTAAERQDVLATDVIHDAENADERFYNGNDENWCVDFTGVAAGFLCNSLLEMTALEAGPMEDAISVVDKFLKYVLQHDVCPEFDEDVLQALDVCKLASEEWPMIAEVLLHLPGEFNLAATELFSKVRSDDWSFEAFKRPEDFNPKAVFYSALATADNNTLFHDVCRDKLKLVREFEAALEFVSVVRPKVDIVQRFNMMVFSDGNSEFTLQAIGKATLKRTIVRDEWDRPETACPIGDREITLFLEDSILARIKPGMKMVANIGELSGGFFFLKSIHKIVPSFYTFLPQEMMMHYKRPRENERPAPSIHDAVGLDSYRKNRRQRFLSEEIEEVNGGRRT